MVVVGLDVDNSETKKRGRGDLRGERGFEFVGKNSGEGGREGDHVVYPCLSGCGPV